MLSGMKKYWENLAQILDSSTSYLIVYQATPKLCCWSPWLHLIGTVTFFANASTNIGKTLTLEDQIFLTAELSLVHTL